MSRRRPIGKDASTTGGRRFPAGQRCRGQRRRNRGHPRSISGAKRECILLMIPYPSWTHIKPVYLHRTRSNQCITNRSKTPIKHRDIYSTIHPSDAVQLFPEPMNVMLCYDSSDLDRVGFLKSQNQTDLIHNTAQNQSNQSIYQSSK